MWNRRRRIEVWLALAFSTVAFGGCYVSVLDEVTYIDEQQWEVDGRRVSTVDVHTENGAIEVFGSRQSTLEVHATIEVRAPNEYEAEDFAHDIDVVVEREGDVVYIYEEYPRVPHDVRFSVHYKVWMPQSAEAYLRNTNGKIVVHDVHGGIDAETSNGKIELQSVEGRIEARSTNGKIEAYITELDDSGFFSTTNGAIELKIRDGIGRVDATTSNGAIEVTLPRDFSGQLDARTSNGSVTSEIPLYTNRRNWSDENSLVGEIGRGGRATVTLRTSNGTIRLWSY